MHQEYHGRKLFEMGQCTYRLEQLWKNVKTISEKLTEFRLCRYIIPITTVTRILMCNVRWSVKKVGESVSQLLYKKCIRPTAFQNLIILPYYMPFIVLTLRLLYQIWNQRLLDFLSIFSSSISFRLVSQNFFLQLL